MHGRRRRGRDGPPFQGTSLRVRVAYTAGPSSPDGIRDLVKCDHPSPCRNDWVVHDRGSLSPASGPPACGNATHFFKRNCAPPLGTGGGNSV